MKGFLVACVILFSMIIAQSAESEESPAPSLITPGFDSERIWSRHDDWEPAIAADPSSTYVYQLTTRYSGPLPCKDCPLPAIVFRKSSDSGITWSQDRFLFRTKRKQNDPQIEVAGDGTIYAVWLDDHSPGVKFIKSYNRGVSWTAPIALTGPGKKPAWGDKPVLAISEDGRDVYIAFNAKHSFIAVSHDYGRTFSSPVRTNLDDRYWFHTAGAVSSTGMVYFSAVDYSRNYRGNANVNILTSGNHGVTWITSQLDVSRESPGCEWAKGCYFGFLGSSVALAVDISGRVMIAYNAGDTNARPQKLYLRTSSDGILWSRRLEVSRSLSSNVNHALPALSIGATAGDFRLVWQDDRAGSWNTWYSRTTDGGNTWSPSHRISDLGYGAKYKNTNGHKFPYGDYLEIATDSTGINHIVWGEGDSYAGPGGTWYTRGH